MMILVVRGTSFSPLRVLAADTTFYISLGLPGPRPWLHHGLLYRIPVIQSLMFLF